MYSNICAFCAHWDIGTNSIEKRLEALQNKETYKCTQHSPAEFEGKETCNYFDGVK